MTTKHTPGPWEWQRPFSRNLAKCLSGGGRPLLRCIDVSDANARLIAAAPDLLEALKRSRAQWIHSVNADYCLAAIAKAEGQ